MTVFAVIAQGSDGLYDTVLLKRDSIKDARKDVREGLEGDRPGVVITILSAKRVGKGAAESLEMEGARVWY